MDWNSTQILATSLSCGDRICLKIRKNWCTKRWVPKQQIFFLIADVFLRKGNDLNILLFYKNFSRENRVAVDKNAMMAVTRNGQDNHITRPRDRSKKWLGEGNLSWTKPTPFLEITILTKIPGMPPRLQLVVMESITMIKCQIQTVTITHRTRY